MRLQELLTLQGVKTGDNSYDARCPVCGGKLGIANRHGNIDITCERKCSLLAICQALNCNPSELSAFENIPPEMRGKRQWVLWKLEEKDGKQTKIPYMVRIDQATRGHEKADTTKPQTWDSFENAIASLKKSKGEFSGLGFVFNSDLVGIDLDHCRENGQIKPSEKNWVNRIGSYAELSQSGNGVHVVVKGKKPGTACKNTKLGYEIYDQNRFFAITGDVLPGYETIKENQAAINEFYAATFPTPPPAAKQNLELSPLMEDQQIIRLAGSAKNSAKFNALWSGDWAGYPSQSEADLALCSILAFYTQDTAQLDRLFQTSGLIRSKWNERHGAETYGMKTMQNVLSKLAAHYQPPRQQPISCENSTTTVAVVEPLEKEEVKRTITLDTNKINRLFGLYWQQFDGQTETCKEYVLSSLLVSFGTLLGNRVSLASGFKLKPNLYLALVGGSTFMRKTTGMDLGTLILRKINEPKKERYIEEYQSYQKEFETWKSLAKKDRGEQPETPRDFSNIYSEVTPEKLLDKMQDKPDGCFMYSELGGFLAQLENSYMKTFKEKLTDFYDGRGDLITRETISRPMTVIKGVAPSFIGCSSFEWLQNHLDQSDINSGFLARFLFVVRREYPSKWISLPPLYELNSAEWLKRAECLEKLRMDLTLSPEAVFWHKNWYEKQASWSISQALESHGFLGRLLTACHKIAIINHCIANVPIYQEEIGRGDLSHFPRVIEVESYMQAEHWINFFAANILSCYDEIACEPDWQEKKILDVIRRRGEKKGEHIVIPQSLLCSLAHLKLKELNESMDGLQAKNLVSKITSNTGKRTIWQILA